MCWFGYRYTLMIKKCVEIKIDTKQNMDCLEKILKWLNCARVNIEPNRCLSICLSFTIYLTVPYHRTYIL